MGAERRVGLRVDVCHYEALSRGTPPLLEVLARTGARATFFVTMGPDRSGRAALRVLTRPGFLSKMVRTGAPRMYGLRTLLSGTLLPARPVGSGLPSLLRAIRAAGHEVGIHAWDHVTWHDRLEGMSSAAIAEDYRLAADAFERVLGEKPRLSAAPAWRATNESLAEEDGFGFSFSSDCRGHAPFYPRIDGRVCRTLQVPVTLPTLDERLGVDGMGAGDFFEATLDALAAEGRTHVFCAHAEAEGRLFREEFERFAWRARERGVRLVPLGEIAESHRGARAGAVRRESVPGRAGWLAWGAVDER